MESPSNSGGDSPTRRSSIQSNRPDYFTSLRRNSVATLLEESPLQQSFRNLSKSTADATQVEVRLKNYSHCISVRIDAPSIKTVFNTSPCYVGVEFVRNVGEIITGRKKVSIFLSWCFHLYKRCRYVADASIVLYLIQIKDIFGHYEKRYILKDINLALKPGTTYLVMGPPGEILDVCKP